MNIEVSCNSDTCTLLPEGWIDSAGAAELDQAISENAETCEKMILDLCQVEYISSAGLRVFVAAHRRMAEKQGLFLRHVNNTVLDIISLTGFDKKLNIEKD